MNINIPSKQDLVTALEIANHCNQILYVIYVDAWGDRLPHPVSHFFKTLVGNECIALRDTFLAIERTDVIGFKIQ